MHKAKGSGPLPTSALSRAAKRAPDTVSPRPSTQETLRIVLASLDDMKAEDTTTIDITGKTSIGDYMVVTSGRSQRHVTSLADRVVKDLHQAKVPGIRVEGMKQGDWVLIDAGDVIIHIFRPDVRGFYNLEKMWSTAGRANTGA
jgi:ribosome-associated protein